MGLLDKKVFYYPHILLFPNDLIITIVNAIPSLYQCIALHHSHPF
jgi:hypothetical protein